MKNPFRHRIPAVAFMMPRILDYLIANDVRGEGDEVIIRRHAMMIAESFGSKTKYRATAAMPHTALPLMRERKLIRFYQGELPRLKATWRGRIALWFDHRKAKGAERHVRREPAAQAAA